MKEQNTNNIDIEELLLSKTFDELTETERSFVMTQVESATEYEELAVTLQSIKQVSSEQENVLIPNRIKTELLEKMEGNAARNGGFTWSSVGNFLFPKDTALFRKPGLQFASIALLFLLVINIGLDFTPSPQGKLAINTVKDMEFSPKETELKKKEEGFYDIEINKNQVNQEPQQPVEIKIEEEIPAPVLIVKDEVKEDLALDMDEAPVANDAKNGSFYKQKEKMVESADEIEYEEKVVVETTKTNATRSQPGVSLNEVVTTSNKNYKKVKVQLASQSLKQSEEIIDLLFVAM